MKINKKTVYSAIIIILAGIFFCFYSYTIWSVWLPQFGIAKHLIFNWPDANANYYFADQFSIHNSFLSLEYLNFWTDNLLHTRSINVIDGWLVPMTFLPGLLVFGLSFKLLGPLGILFFTPFLASITIYIIYQLFNKVFHDLDLSFISCLLLLPLAPWLFFANEPMLPTILFIFLLSFGLLGLFLSVEKKKDLWFIIGSCLVIFSLAVRPTEALWVLAILAILYYFYRHQISRTQLFIFGIFLVITILLSLSFNVAIYGDWLLFGYQNLQDKTLPTEFVSTTNNLWNYFRLVFLPFGWETRILLANVWHYLLQLMWPYFLLGLISLAYLKKNIFDKNSAWGKYFLITAIVYIIIIIYYANWNIADPLVKQFNTISISYVRYFLPLYILLLPFVAKTILSLTKLKNKYLGTISVVILIFALGIFSVRLAFYAPMDGLVQNSQNLQDYYQQFYKVSNLAPRGSIIITERSDKIFFPYYRVVAPQGDLPLWPRIANIIEKVGVYFYTSETGDRLENIKKEAAKSNLYFDHEVQIDDEFKLIKVELNN